MVQDAVRVDVLDLGLGDRLLSSNDEKHAVAFKRFAQLLRMFLTVQRALMNSLGVVI